MAKDRRTKDQKRRAKLQQRSLRTRPSLLTPYEGRKYREPRWTDAVFRTEMGVYETWVMLDRALTNDEVEAAFKSLITSLDEGMAPLLSTEEEKAAELPVNVGLVTFNIRRNWEGVVEKQGPIAAADWIGILRTLLYSIKAHAANNGRALGYLHFLKNFMPQTGVQVSKLSPEDSAINELPTET